MVDVQSQGGENNRKYTDAFTFSILQFYCFIRVIHLVQQRRWGRLLAIVCAQIGLYFCFVRQRYFACNRSVNEGQFRDIVPDHPDHLDADTLQEAYDALDSSDMDVLRRTPFPESTGFIWTSDCNLKAIMTQIDSASSYGHSGASLALTMQHMQIITRNGWDDYVRMRRAQWRDRCKK